MTEIGNFIVAHWETLLGVLLLLLATDGIAGYLPDKWVPYIGAVKRVAQILLTRFGKGVPIILAVLMLSGCAGLKMEETAAPMAIPPPPGLSGDGARGIRVEGAVAMGSSSLTAVTVAALPTGAEGKSAVVSDGADSCDCTVGSGTVTVECVYSEGAWVSKTCAGTVTDVDDLPGDTVDDDLIDADLLAITSIDLTFSASEASGQPMNADRTYSGIPHTGFICSEIMQHGYPVFVNASAQLQVADADGASMAPAWGVFVLYQKLTGTHNGSADAATLSDSTASFVVDAYIGSMVFNITDSSECIVTDNDGTTVTCTLSGGTDNDWDASDAYEIGLPAYLDSGWIREDVWDHTAGATCYLDDTEGYPVEAAGAPATTGDIYQPIGIALDADRIMLKIDPVNGWYTYVE